MRTEPMRGRTATRRERRTLMCLRRDIRRRGVAIAQGCMCLQGIHLPTLYTVGLTRHRGHPELLVTGLPQREAVALLHSAADAVAHGERLAPGWDLITDDDEYRAVAVAVPEHLWLAQLMYAPSFGPPVPALQLVPLKREMPSP